MYNRFDFSKNKLQKGRVQNSARPLFKIEKNPVKAIFLNNMKTSYYRNKNDRVFYTGSDNISQKIRSITEECRVVYLEGDWVIW